MVHASRLRRQQPGGRGAERARGIRGLPVVLDATFTDRAQRARVLTLAERPDARCDFLLCQADEPTVRARIAARQADEDAASERT